MAEWPVCLVAATSNSQEFEVFVLVEVALDRKNREQD